MRDEMFHPINTSHSAWCNSTVAILKQGDHFLDLALDELSQTNFVSQTYDWHILESSKPHAPSKHDVLLANKRPAC